MKKSLLLFVTVCSLAVVSLLGFRQASDPNRAYQEILQYQSEQMRAAQQAGTQPDRAAISAEVRKRAEAAIAGVDPASVDATNGLAWARLFNMAQKNEGAITLLQRFLGTSPADALKSQAQNLLVSLLYNTEKIDELIKFLETVEPVKPDGGLGLLNFAAFASEDISAKVGVARALAILNRIEAAIDFKAITDPRQIQAATNARLNALESRVDLLIADNKSAEAMKAIDAMIASLPESDNANKRRLGSLKNQKMLVGSAAPELVFDRKHGNFTNLAAWRGKVVIVDFFAHWCGPCKASLPSLGALYNELHSKGLEMVHVTRLYGFYEAERNMAPDVEFGKMVGFMEQHKMTWPVIYVDNATFEKYGVSGIPHVAVVDKKGVVRKLKIGFSPAGIDAFKKDILALLAE